MPPAMVMWMNEICLVIKESRIQRKRKESKEIGEGKKNAICGLIYRPINRHKHTRSYNNSALEKARFHKEVITNIKREVNVSPRKKGQ